MTEELSSLKDGKIYLLDYKAHMQLCHGYGFDEKDLYYFATVYDEKTGALIG